MKYILIAALLITGPVFATNYPNPQPIMESTANATAIAVSASKSTSHASGGAAFSKAAGGSVGDIDIEVIDSRVVNHNLGDTAIDLEGAVTVPVDINSPVTVKGGNQSVYIPRNIPTMSSSTSTMTAQGNSVSMPTVGIIAQDIQSESHYGDDRVLGLRLDIPITWGLPKRKDVISSGLNEQRARTQRVIDETNIMVQTAAQNLRQQREVHQGQMMEVCLTVYHTLGTIDPDGAGDLSRICGAYSHPKGAIPPHKGFCNPGQASPHTEECSDPDSEYHE